MGYNLKLTKRIDLSHLGTDNNGNPFYVEIVNLNAMPYEQKLNYINKMSESFGDIDTKKAQAGDLSGFKITKENIAGLKDAVKLMIKSWNLLDFEGQPAKLDDPDVFDKIPGVVVDEILVKMNETDEETEKAKN